MAPGYPRILFTRQQLGELTGVDNNTLNYWMREELLRPAEGGEGRGSHRRFAFTEVNIAAILNEVRQFGIGLPSLRALSDRFHSALDWMAERGVTFENQNVFTEFALERQRYLEVGHLEIDASIHQKKYPQTNAEVHGSGPYAQVHISWEEALELYILPTIVKSEMLNHKEALKIVESLSKEEWQEYSKIRSYYYHATAIVKRLYEGSELNYFYRNDVGEWMMSANDCIIPVSVIAIDMSRLNYNVWSKLA